MRGGLPQDDVRAVHWFRLAAEQGDTTAQASLGRMYFVGRGVPQDAIQAAMWFRLSAEEGERGAQAALGHMYQSGEGVPRNDVEAFKWFRLAAEQGHANSQASLGLMYEYGHGTRRNAAQALRWYRIGAEQGHGVSQGHADELTDDPLLDAVAVQPRLFRDHNVVLRIAVQVIDPGVTGKRTNLSGRNLDRKRVIERILVSRAKVDPHGLGLVHRHHYAAATKPRVG